MKIEKQSRGWREECYESVVEEKYKLIETNKEQDCVEICDVGVDCEQKENEQEIFCKVYFENLDCYYDCTNVSLQPYIHYWNETVCVKKVLVKEVWNW